MFDFDSVPGLAGVHGRARTCDLRIRNPLLFRLSYVDLVPGVLGVPARATVASGDSVRNAKDQHMGHEVTLQAAEPDLPLVRA